MNRIIFLGPQGSGKSTQAEMIATELKIPHLEMGHLLRQKMEDDDEDAKKIREALEVGNLVPNEITIRTLNQRLQKEDCAIGFIIDGYPRNEEQLNNLPDGIDTVIYVAIPDEVAIQRLAKRARADDTEEVIKKRLEIYHRETEPLLKNFKGKGILMEIDGLPAIEEVNKDILNKIKNGTQNV